MNRLHLVRASSIWAPAAWLGLSALGLGALALGCPGTNGGTVSIEELPARIAPSYCGLFDRCPNPYISAFFFGGRDCAESIEPILEDTFLGRADEAIRDGTVVYRGDLVDQCIRELDGAGCNLDQLSVSACTSIFEGTIAAGGDCSWDEECIEGYCSTTDGMCPGTCATRAALGGACTTDQNCSANLDCVDGACVERSGAGELCEGEDNIACSGIDLTCVGSEGAMPGTCRSWAQIFDGGVGDPCAVPDDLCDEGLSCVFSGVAGGMATFTCAAGVAAGATCAQGFPDPCPDDQFCMMGGAPGMGVCTALPTSGQPCPTGACAPGLRCATPSGGTGTCVTPARLGQPCVADAACLSSSCQDGVCATPGC